MVYVDDTAPRGGGLSQAFMALLIGPIICALYGFFGAMVTLVLIDLLMLMFAFVIPMIFVARMTAGWSRRLLLAIPCAAFCVTALWFGWFAAEMGFAEAWRVLLLGPIGQYALIVELSGRYIYESSEILAVRPSEVTHGSGYTALTWAGETATIAAGPIVGALFGSRLLADDQEDAVWDDADQTWEEDGSDWDKQEDGEDRPDDR